MDYVLRLFAIISSLISAKIALAWSVPVSTAIDHQDGGSIALLFVAGVAGIITGFVQLLSWNRHRESDRPRRLTRALVRGVTSLTVGIGCLVGWLLLR